MAIAAAISNWKGGAGKTTTTSLICSLMNFHTNLRVAVVDVDPQHSAIAMRQTELKTRKLAIQAGQPDPLQKALGELKGKGKPVYRIIPINFEAIRDTVDGPTREEYAGYNFGPDMKPDMYDMLVDAAINRATDDSIVETCEDIISSDEFDVVFFDFPGFKGESQLTEEEEKNTDDDAIKSKMKRDLRNKNIYARILRLMNYVMVPINVDKNSISSTKQYLKLLSELRNNNDELGSRLADFSVFKWRFSNAKNTTDFINYTKALSKMGAKVFDSIIYDSNEFMMGYSTIRPVDMPKEKSLMPFMNEVIEFCNLKNN